MASFKRSEIRKILGEACTEEIENQLVALHMSVLDPLKDERDELKAQADKYKADAEKLSSVQQQLDALKDGDYEAKYTKEHADFEAYKTKVEGEALAGKKRSALMAILEEEKISQKRRDGICKLESINMDAYTLDDKGRFTDEKAIRKRINEEYAEYKVTDERERGEDVAHPPRTDNGQPAGAVRKMVAQWHAERYGNGQTNNE